MNGACFTSSPIRYAMGTVSAIPLCSKHNYPIVFLSTSKQVSPIISTGHLSVAVFNRSTTHHKQILIFR